MEKTLKSEKSEVENFYKTYVDTDCCLLNVLLYAVKPTYYFGFPGVKDLIFDVDIHLT